MKSEKLPPVDKRNPLSPGLPGTIIGAPDGKISSTTYSRLESAS